MKHDSSVQTKAEEKGGIADVASNAITDDKRYENDSCVLAAGGWLQNSESENISDRGHYSLFRTSHKAALSIDTAAKTEDKRSLKQEQQGKLGAN